MIVFVLPSSAYGGHEIMAIKIISRIKSERVLVVYDPRNSEVERSIKRLSNVEAFPVEFADTKLSFILGRHTPCVKKTVRILGTTLMDVPVRKIVVVNGNAVANYTTTVAIGLVCELKKCPAAMYIPMLHLWKEFGFGFLKGAIYTNMVRMALGVFDEYWTISEAWASRIKRINSAASVRVIHNYVDRSNINIKANRRPECDGLSKIAFVGRLERGQKGLDLLLKTLTKISIVAPNIHVDIVGDGQDRDYLYNSITRSDTNISHTFHGWVSDPSPIIQQSDLLLMTSRLEGLPLVALEAYRQGKPVFSFNIAGVSDILPEPCMAEPFDCDKLAQSVLDYLFRRTELCGVMPKVELIDRYYDLDRFESDINVALG